MNPDFPSAVPEIPVNDVDQAAGYYVSCLGFNKDWGAMAAASVVSPEASAGCS